MTLAKNVVEMIPDNVNVKLQIVDDLDKHLKKATILGFEIHKCEDDGAVLVNNHECQIVSSHKIKLTRFIGEMFDGRIFKTLNLTGLDTSELSHIQNLFSGLTVDNLIIKDWDTSNIESMYRCFYKFKSSEKLDLSALDVKNVTDMTQCFACCKLPSIELNSWNTKRLRFLEGTFSNSIIEDCIDIYKWDVYNVENTEAMFFGCTTPRVTLNNWRQARIEDMAGMFKHANISKLYLNDLNIHGVHTLTEVFSNIICDEIHIECWNTENVWGMESMFEKAKIKSELNIRAWNTRGLFNMDNMFKGASIDNLMLFNIGEQKSNRKTEKVVYMRGMFNNFKSPSSEIKIGKLHYGIIDAGGMLDNCECKSIDLTGLNKSIIYDIDSMLNNVKSKVIGMNKNKEGNNYEIKQ